MLTDERYKGDVLLQKTYTVDYLTKKSAKNTGEVPQYYIENHHEGIISRNVFDAVQVEIKKRSQENKRCGGSHLYVHRIVCGDCGGFYGHKIWHSNDASRKEVWRCNEKYKNEEKCETPVVTEQQIRAYFMRAQNNLYRNRNKVIEEIEALLAEIGSKDEWYEKLEKARAEYGEEVEKLEEAKMKCSDTNDVSWKRYEKQLAAVQDKQKELDYIKERCTYAGAAEESLSFLIGELKYMRRINSSFDSQLWARTVDKMTVYRGGDVIFTFKGGYEMTVTYDELNVDYKKKKRKAPGQ